VPRKPVVRRAPKRSAAAADTSAVFGEYGLTESYKRSVEAAFGSAQACITELFWLELETVVGVFLSLQQKHVNSPPRQQREFWRRFAERTSDLANNLRIIRRQTRWGHSDPMWANRGLMALWEIQQRADLHVLAYDDIVQASRRYPHRSFLYDSICDFWVWNGRQLRYSTSPAGVPTGPLIRFIEACANPLLAKPLSAHGIRDFIDRRKGRKVRKGGYGVRARRK
jgi:hypothetical protein